MFLHILAHKAQKNVPQGHFSKAGKEKGNQLCKFDKGIN